MREEKNCVGYKESIDRVLSAENAAEINDILSTMGKYVGLVGKENIANLLERTPGADKSPEEVLQGCIDGMLKINKWSGRVVFDIGDGSDRQKCREVIFAVVDEYYEKRA